MKTYRNSKTIQARNSDGSFRRFTGDDVGIDVCPKCSHLTVTPPEPDSFKRGMIAPEDFRRWNKARVCHNCGWQNEEAAALPVATQAALLWTKNNGDIVDLSYLRRRVGAHLSSRWRTIYSNTARKAAISATLNSASWLEFRNGCTVGAIVRDVEHYLLESQKPSGMTGPR